jgi:hypothetical protein
VALSDLSVGNVTAFQVTNLENNQTVQVTLQGKDWHMQQPKDSATDPDKIESTISTVAHVEATRVLTDVADLSAYGLITGTIRATMTLSDTTQFVLKLGNSTIDNSSSYALKGDDKSKIYVIDSSVAAMLKDFVDMPPYPPTATPTLPPSPTPGVTPTVSSTLAPAAPTPTP